MLTCLIVLAVLRYLGVDAGAMWSGTLARPAGKAARRLLLIVLGLFVMPSSAATAQTAPPLASGSPSATLSEEMDRLNVETALLVPSQAVDAHPVWSPEGDRLAANVGGTWYSVSVTQVVLGEAMWRGELPLGVLRSPESVREEPKAALWAEASTASPRRVKADDGTVVELRQTGMSTSLIVTQRGREETLWSSSFENCYFPVLSPQQDLVAFLCELNGVFVYRLDTAAAKE